jgi:hypothetical protein
MTVEYVEIVRRTPVDNVSVTALHAFHLCNVFFQFYVAALGMPTVVLVRVLRHGGKLHVDFHRRSLPAHAHISVCVFRKEQRHLLHRCRLG